MNQVALPTLPPTLQAAPIRVIGKEAKAGAISALLPGHSLTHVPVDVDGLSQSDLREIGRHHPYLAQAIVRPTFAIQRAHIRALQEIVQAGVYPAIVLSADVTLNPAATQLPAMPPTWSLALLGGYVHYRGDDGPLPDGWLATTEDGWFGTLAYAVAMAEAANRLIELWQAEVQLPDFAWRPLLAEPGSVGCQPPLFIETALLAQPGHTLSRTPDLSPDGKRWPLRNAPVYWINLDRRPDHRLWIESQLQDWPGGHLRIPGVDGQQLDPHDVRNYARYRSLARYHISPRHMRGELGCIRSHCRALRTAIAIGQFPAIIIEDDAMLSPRWWELRPPAEWQLLILGGQTSDGASVVPVDRWVDLTHRQWVGAYAYALADADTARVLLARWAREDESTDIGWWDLFPVLRAYGASPRTIHVEKSSSDIRKVREVPKKAAAKPATDPSGG